MSGAQHTPGPWPTPYLTGDRKAHLIDVGLGIEIDCDDLESDEQRDEIAANARLIAAAPDLLAALQSLANNAERIERDSYSLQGHEHFDPETALEYARSAIAKATGA